MTAEITSYQFDTVEVRPAACEVLRDGEPVPLEPKAFRVLLYLIENRERAVTKEELIRAVWQGAAVTDNAITRIVAQLRRGLGDDARQSRYIQTLPTLGYRFVANLKILSSPAPAPPPSRNTARVAIAAVAVVTAAALIWWSRPGAPATAPIPLRPVQVTSSPELDAGGSFSPDGKSIVFSSNRSGAFEIYTQAMGSVGHDVAITSDGRQNIEPAWSPDGKWVAYHSAGAHGIWIMPAAGGAPRQVSTFGSAPSWSPDSSTLAFRSVEPHSFAAFDLVGLNDSTIWTVAADGSRLHQLTGAGNPPGLHASPTWSPDGRRVFFASLWQHQGIWSIDVASGALQPVATGSVPFQGFPLVTRDAIYFAGPSRLGGFSFYRVSPRGGEPVELHEGSDGLPLQMAISPDGRNILYSRSWPISQLWQTGTPSTPAKALFRDMVVRARLPVFSPDGNKLAYLVQREGTRNELWTMNSDGSSAASVAADPSPQGIPLWNANGTAVLYNSFARNRTLLMRVDPGAGAATRVLFETADNLQQPHITAGEQSVIYGIGTPVNLWSRSFDGNAPRQLTFDREGASFPSISPDGRWIAYELQRGNTTQIGVMDIDGGQQTMLTDDPALNWANSWAADNRRITFASFRDGVWNIWWIDRVTRERKQVTHRTAFGEFVRNPAWRPGSEQMVYEHYIVKGNLYVVQTPGT